jgi:ABC-type Fe3+ transport system permease subunit
MIFPDSDRDASGPKAAQVARILGNRPGKAVPRVQLPLMLSRLN